MNGDPENLNPTPMDESMITRFIKEFELEQEALGVQQQVNSVITTINKYLGDEPEASTAQGGIRPGPGQSTSSVSTSSVSTTSSTAEDTGGVLGTIMSIPQTVGKFKQMKYCRVNPWLSNLIPA